MATVKKLNNKDQALESQRQSFCTVSSQRTGKVQALLNAFAKGF